MKSNTKKPGQIFEPLLQEFCEATFPIGMDENFPSIFMPHTMRGYDQASKKIFYFGRDTYGWLPTYKLKKYFDNNQLPNYMLETRKWANEFGFMAYNNNNSSGFWTLALRLHLRLKGITEDLTIGPNLPTEYYDLINDFGWGNTNSIEVPASLKNQNIWNDLDQDKYWKVKEKSQEFDKLIHTIRAFRPDLVFIFNWDCIETEFLDGLDYQETKIPLFNNHFTTYFLPETNTKIIWTLHPNAARWHGYSTDSMVDQILEYIGNEN